MPYLLKAGCDSVRWNRWARIRHPMDLLKQYEGELFAHIEAQHAELLPAIRNGKVLTDEIAEQLTGILESFNKSFLAANAA